MLPGATMVPHEHKANRCLEDQDRKLELRLYVAGTTPRSTEALANLEAICREYFPGRYHIEVIDVLMEPGIAISGGILVTPTLVKVEPPPVRLVVGNLTSRDTVLYALGLLGTKPPPKRPKGDTPK